MITKRFKVLAAVGKSLSILTLGLLASGCDGSTEPFQRAAVRGTVTLDGQPLDGAIIRFIPTNQTVGPKAEFPITNGEFQADITHGPPVGSHRVEINLVDSQWQHDDEQAIEKLQQSPRTRISRPTLPSRYHQESSLAANIEPSADLTPQILTFPLTSQSR